MNVAKGLRRLAVAGVLTAVPVLASGCTSMVVFDPKGPVGEQQRDLIVFTMLLCLVIAVPVFAITAWIIWRYRDKPGNKAAYQPKWEHSTKLETIWWGIPIVAIVILAIVTGIYTHRLDPAKPLKSDNAPITVQVTSLDWKWLFQYPDQGIATINTLVIPENTPVKFDLTSDGPMNSFWVPQLGGMIYTMSGMATTLHLQADEVGDYFGTGANFTGREFAKMAFTTKAVTQDEFDGWINEVKSKGGALTDEAYQQLVKPGTSPIVTYGSISDGLFHRIVHDYSMNRGAEGGLGRKATTLSDLHKERENGGSQPVPDLNLKDNVDSGSGMEEMDMDMNHEDTGAADTGHNH
ncbi:ubiquinol oxidase subunit II [Paenibacillus nasutitermitis]|uniref:Cytochrome c oxidase subunit 2 n=1 Tax=Paenibacillus nasutitermitis TaxID=1652958 RepID=A0A917DR46_9BACL|nr:ubiquinol oxidase subunit II [Paenibacillus nasutitermitis]GGD58567.1 ubiquinol oxidase subunit 2 [Paenibacillus nasutitermitis]